MKKINSFFKKHTWLFVLLVCALFIPQSFSYQAKLNSRVIVTGLAIDKTESGYEITAQVVMPSPGSESGGSSARIDFISEQGQSIVDGIQKIAYKIGKEAALSHTDFIMLGKSMMSENIVPALDYFARDDQVSPALMLVVCDESAKDTIQKTKDLELSVGVGLRKVFINKQESLCGIMTGTIDFINQSYNLSGSSILSGIYIASEGEEFLESGGSATNSSLPGGSQNGSSSSDSGSGSGSSSSSSGGSGSGSSSSSSGGSGGSGSGGQGGQSEEKKARIKFYNDIYYFKFGRYVGKLSGENEVVGMFFATKESKNGKLKLNNVSGGSLSGATVGVQISNKDTHTRVKFKDDKPVLRFDISIETLQLEEILNASQPTVELYNQENNEVSSAIIRAAKEQIEDSIRAAFEKTKADGVDIFHIAELCYQTKTKEWKEFYRAEGDNYLAKCDIEVNVNIKTFS